MSSRRACIDAHLDERDGQVHAFQGWLPRRHEWERATGIRPCARTIDWRWGWRELLAEAIGVTPNQSTPRGRRSWTSEPLAMLAALNAARDELGRWPQAWEWESAWQQAVIEDLQAPLWELGGFVSCGGSSVPRQHVVDKAGNHVGRSRWGHGQTASRRLDRQPDRR